MRAQTHQPNEAQEASTHAAAVRRVRAGASVADLVVDLGLPLGVARDLFTAIHDSPRFVLTERDVQRLEALGYGAIDSGRALVQLVEALRNEASAARRTGSRG